jgi:hypothetical protein
VSSDAAQRLARIAADMRERRVPAHADADMLAAAIEAYSRGDGDLAECLGLAALPGERAPRNSVALATRDGFIRAAAADFFTASGSKRGAARDLHSALSRYATAGWLRDRTLDECPKQYAERARGALWNILKAHPALPSESSIRRVLGVAHEFDGDEPRINPP